MFADRLRFEIRDSEDQKFANEIRDIVNQFDAELDQLLQDQFYSSNPDTQLDSERKRTLGGRKAQPPRLAPGSQREKEGGHA